MCSGDGSPNRNSRTLWLSSVLWIRGMASFFRGLRATSSPLPLAAAAAAPLRLLLATPFAWAPLAAAAVPLFAAEAACEGWASFCFGWWL